MALFKVAGGNDGPGSFAGFKKEDDGTLRRLEGWEWDAYLKGGNTPQEMSQDQFAGVLSDATTKTTGGGIPAGYLSQANQSMWDSKSGTSKPAPTPATSPELTSLLSRYGVNYEKAPAPTPGLLAFLRGIGLNMDTAEDTAARTRSRIKERSTSALSDVDRQDQRTQRNIMGDLISRGVFSSGEANTRYGQQSENVAKAKSDIARNQAEGLEQVDTALAGTRDQLRMSALERTIGEEERQTSNAATTAAQEASYARQEAAAEIAYQRQRKMQEELLAQQERNIMAGLAS